MIDVKEILSTQDDMITERRLEEPYWRQLTRLFRPDDREFDPAEVHNGERDDADIFDSTGLYAADDHAKGMLKQACSPANRWLALSIEDKELAKWGPVRDWLWRATDKFLRSVSVNRSRFYLEMQPSFSSTAVFGFGPTYQAEDLGSGRIIDRAIPIGQCYMRVDAHGNLDHFNRERRLYGRQLKRMFKALTAVDRCLDTEHYRLLHAVYPNPDPKPGKIGRAAAPFWSTYVVRELAEEWREDGHYEEMCYHVPMWSPRANSAYPSGAGHNARADALMLQEMEHSHIAAGQMTAEPPLLTRDETRFTAADIEPNAVLEGGMGEAGKPAAQFLEKQNQLHLTLAMSDQRRAVIRKAFYFTNSMLLANRPQMTAAEVDYYKQDELEQAAPNLVNIQFGGLSPYVRRRMKLLSRMGALAELGPAPPELMRAALEIDYVSPLAKAQQAQVARQATGWVSTMLAIGEVRADALDNVNVDGYARVTHEGMSGVPDLINDPDTVKRIREQRAAAAAQNAELEQAATGAKVFADVAHASQAMTSSKQRGKAA